jgi:hypothetical protein
MTTIIIIDKGCTIKTLTVKQYNVDELYKKCGFKKAEGFSLQVEWLVKLDNTKYVLQMYGKTDGKSNMENKYDFPPPVDKKLYFGSCAVVGFIKNELNINVSVNLSIELWNKLYDKMFGGFEDLATTEVEDENESDELENIPKNMKTKVGGYLKDGFIVDNSDIEDDDDDGDEDANTYNYECSNNCQQCDDDSDCITLEDIGSELAEEEYE